MRQFVADFETTTNEDDCRVWVFGIMELGNHDNVTIGYTIEDFMKWCMEQPDNPRVYFRNLKFDSAFFIYWLFTNGFRHVSSAERETNTFTTVINNKGLFYAVEVVFYLKGKKVNKVTFWDSMKLIPLSIEATAETFKLPYKKRKIDYDRHNNLPVGSPITDEEREYLLTDLLIDAISIEYFHSQGLNRMTIGSCALHEYKTLIGKSEFKKRFPTLRADCHNEIKQAYKGGYVYVMPEVAERQLKRGIVLDKNSMFPWIMKEKLLPWGTPIFYRGEYKPDAMYPLYIQTIRCSFELKPGMLPTLQIKNSIWFSGTEYLRSSEDRELTLCLTSVDLDLFLKHYEVYNLEYVSGWKFRGAKGMFDVYIDKWNAKKIEARANDNPGLEYIAKLYLNNLYGKFGTSNKLQEKIPYLSEKDGAIHYKDTKATEKDGIYLPVAAFVTSWARSELVTSAQTIIDDYNSGKSKIRFVYSDTDSLHCLSDDYSLPEGLEIDKYKLGAWKFESKFRRAKFLRTKCYIEDSTRDVYNDSPEWDLKVTVAGMPEGCKDQVSFHNFRIGATYSGKKQPKAVKGGVVLQAIDFTIKKV